MQIYEYYVCVNNTFFCMHLAYLVRQTYSKFPLLTYKLKNTYFASWCMYFDSVLELLFLMDPVGEVYPHQIFIELTSFSAIHRNNGDGW